MLQAFPTKQTLTFDSVAKYSTAISSSPQVAYLTADTLGTPRINTNATGAVISRHDYQPYGEEIAGVGGRTQALGYAADDVRKQFTGYERDDESGLDFAEARMYANQLGRFTTTDPIIMSLGRAFDPQQTNLYAYVRNNPFAFIDPSGEDIIEPTGLSREDQEAYEKWRDTFLSTAEGRATWDKYKNDKSFMLTITVPDRGTDDKNKSAEVKNFTFDKDGKLVGATMELGRNLGKDHPGDGTRYPIQSALVDTSSAEVGATKIAHEFGHLDDFQSMGKLFYDQQQIGNEINARQAELTA